MWLDILLHGYAHKAAVLEAASYGVQHRMSHPRPPDTTPADNHRSAQRFASALERSIAEGQGTGTYIVIDTATALAWKRLRFSPFGMVPKKDIDPLLEGRLIHNLSFLEKMSVNGCSSQDDLPALLFEPVRRLAERIEVLAMQYPFCAIKIMKGDVKGAFRHIPVASRLAQYFAGSFSGGSIIDLALPFGWTGSPAHYGVFGGAIAFLLGRESPASLEPRLETDDSQFFSYVWVDDHVMIEPDVGQRLHLASQALRLAMLAVLGPKAINEKKFSPWETRLQALGLVWDTTTRTVSMPQDKVDKAISRIQEALAAHHVSKLQLAQLLGSLRHVSTCIRATRAFLQRLHSAWINVRAHSRVRLSHDTRQDLQWVAALLRGGAANEVPASIVAGTSQPQVHLFMDASDHGLCVIYPAAKEFIRVQFDADERIAISKGDADFSINVRESLSVAVAAIVWGPQWKALAQRDPIHIRCWIDNASAVAWMDRHQSKNAAGQELIRVVSCAEAQFNIHFSTAHLAGSANIMADRGSRAWYDSPRRIPQDLQQTIVSLQWKSLADTSRRVYLNTWRQWCEFCTRHGFNRWLPVDDPVSQSVQLTVFAVRCWRSDRSATPLRFETIRAKVSHVAWCHQLVRGFRPQLLPQHQLAFNGMQRLSPPQRRRGAVSTKMLQTIAGSLDLSIPQHRVICGAAVLGFFFCLRGSEFLSSNGRRHAYCITTSDVRVPDAVGMDTMSYRRAAVVRITIKASKTDQQGRSTTRELLKGSQPPICPVFAALLLLKTAQAMGKRHGTPLCSINAHQVLSTLTKCSPR